MFDTKLVEITDFGFAAITRLKVDDALLAGVERTGWRLVVECWKLHRGYDAGVDVEDAICGVLFNAMGYLHELLKAELEKEKAA